MTTPSVRSGSQVETRDNPAPSQASVQRYDFAGHRPWYVARLARENGWTFAYADRVLDEYLRFALLSAVAGHVVVPSEQVDQAWHLHITDTQVYEAFGRDVLQRPLHHRPGRGRPGERQELLADYQRTLQSYQSHFGHAPPVDVWPEASRRFGPDLRQRRVTLAEHWVVPKRALRQGAKVAGWLGLAAMLGGAAPTLLAWAGPLDWDGPTFLTFFAGMLCVSLAAGLLARWMPRTPADIAPRPVKLSPCELAYLSGGRASAVYAAVAWLDAGGYVHLNPGLDYRMFQRRSPRDADPFVMQVWQAGSGTSRGRSLDEVIRRSAPASDEIAERLTDLGLLLRSGRAASVRLMAAAMPVVVLGLGLAKVWVGFWRDKPVLFLVIGCVVAAVLAWWLGRAMRPPRTRRGDALLRDCRRDASATRARLKAGRSEPAEVGPEEAALAVAAFGPTILAGTVLAGLPAACKYERQRQAASGDGGGFIGGGDSGNSGGGCGGGCGGCGGD